MICFMLQYPFVAYFEEDTEAYPNVNLLLFSVLHLWPRVVLVGCGAVQHSPLFMIRISLVPSLLCWTFSLLDGERSSSLEAMLLGP